MDVRGVSFEVRHEFKALCNYYEFCFHVYVIISMYHPSGNSKKKLNINNLQSEITELGLKSGYLSELCMKLEKLKKVLNFEEFLFRC